MVLALPIDKPYRNFPLYTIAIMNDVSTAADVAKRPTPANERADAYYLALDWESAGDGWDHALLACGVVFGDQLGSVIESRRFCRTVPPRAEFQADTWEWWHEPPSAKNDFFDGAALLARIDEQATFTTTPEIVKAVFDYVLSFETRFGPFGRGFGKLVLLGDNVLFDYGKMDAILCANKLTSKPIRQSFSGYVKVYDPSEQLRALSDVDKYKVQARITAKHSHDPVDDALHIYQMQCAIDVVIASRDQFEKKAATK